MMRSTTRREPSTVGTLVFLMWGLIAWGLQFTAVYLAHTWHCALGAPRTVVGVVTAVLTVIAVIAILPVLLLPARSGRLVGLREEEQPHLLTIGRAVALISMIAALWTGLTVAFVDACAPAR